MTLNYKLLSHLMINVVFFLSVPNAALAHVSEQGIVLLLPTGTYILSGCLAVVFSMIVVALIPHRLIFKLFAVKNISPGFANQIVEHKGLKDALSLLSLIFVIGLIIIGSTGSRDPLTNLLPLSIWTFFWILVFMLHCIFPNLWLWLNPWTGLANRIFPKAEPLIRLPSNLGQWPATLAFIGFYLFIIVDLAPDDPARLSNVVLGYVTFNFVGIYIFGQTPWLRQVECFSVLFDLISRLAPVHYEQETKGWRVGVPGWKALESPDKSASQAFFLLTMLACGSFDGVNETFWWLAQIDINPLAFPGRSAVVLPSTLGMISAILIVYSLFSIIMLLSFWLVKNLSNTPNRAAVNQMQLFQSLAITILPITAVYHGSHYFTSYLINSQYLLAAISDPLANGSNYLGLVDYQVTTGYLGEIASVKRIWLTQASLVVYGHILAVLMSHYFIAKAFPERRDAIIFHVPVSVFMAGYTWFGLWLLAAPKGA